MTRLTLIVAATRNNGIGQNSQLPWRLSKEMAYFKRVTTAAPEGHLNAVVMGRNTWESIPPKFRPLNQRLNVVVSSNAQYDLKSPATSCVSVHLHTSLEDALGRLSAAETQDAQVHRAFVIGGASLYRDTLALALSAKSFVDRVLLTRILAPAFEGCDVFMPDFVTTSECAEQPWHQASHEELQEWVGFEVAAGVQEENGVQYEFQMWVRQ
ncbi:dihydrofolate reductase [Epithele typhae]|uniref:dihydrofolate reductase n=1 Tax=Epithele typhae TaxID=378194 RepID=UPI0020081CA7|nr:dihydrofolate reductase [Epithele typhae]KAH9944346.1 dihydrofolate reductase [Epithele typhae]